MTAGSWDTACPDWRDRIKAGRSLLPALPLDKEQSDRAVAIFNLLRLPDVPGTPTLADAAGEWFRDAVRALFGSYDPATGVRALSELFVLVPKKNSKTTYSAALMLVALFMSTRPRAEFLLVAPTHEVAELAFRQAVGMIESDPVLRAKCHVQDHIKRITYRTTGAFLKVKSFDPRVVTGSKPAGVLLDEVHVIAEAANADRVIGQLRGGLLSQPEGFLVQITTQSERTPSGVFLAELRKARAVRDGRLAAPTLPLLYEFPESVDWRDDANWPMVLPNLGRSINLDRLRTEYRAAREAGPEELCRWASQHLNVEVGVALMADSWAGAEHWAACADRTLTLDELLARSEVVTVGIDGGGLDDLLGLAAIGRERGTSNWLLWARAFAHPVALERNKENQPRYRDFERDGDLVVVSNDHENEDAEHVAELVKRIDDSGLLDRVGVDVAGIGAILDQLEARGIEKDRVVGIPQGWRMNGSIKTLERKAAARTLVHTGSALLAWCVGNAKVEMRASAITVTKRASGVGKIDPLIAAFNAGALMSENPESRGGSFWETADEEVFV